MTERLTAAAAREQSNTNNPDAAVDMILKRVRDSTTRGKYTARITDYGFGDTQLYNNSELTDNQQTIVNQLHDLGYTTATVRVKTKQFVDIYLEVSW